MGGLAAVSARLIDFELDEIADRYNLFQEVVLDKKMAAGEV